MPDPARNNLPWLLAPLLVTQGVWVRLRTPRLPAADGPQQGQGGHGQPLRLMALGDSIIAGVGVSATQQALPSQLAGALAKRLPRRVLWRSRGENGARTRDLLRWTREESWPRADLLVISNGLNDVTGLMALQPWLSEKRELYQQLGARAPGALIAQLGLPPLGHFPALPNPLRQVMGRRAEAFDRALEEMIGHLEGVIHLPFRSVPEPSLFAADGYHPGPEAVTIWANSLAESISPRLLGRL